MDSVHYSITDVPDVQLLSPHALDGLPPLVLLVVIAAQIILTFRHAIAEYISIKLKRLRAALSSSNSNSSYKPFTVRDGVIYPSKITGKTINVVDIRGPAKVAEKDILLDLNSDIRSRYSIFYLNTYDEVSTLMTAAASMDVEILSTTIIYHDEHFGALIFYMSYYGRKIIIVSEEVRADILHG